MLTTIRIQRLSIDLQAIHTAMIHTHPIRGARTIRPTFLIFTFLSTLKINKIRITRLHTAVVPAAALALYNGIKI